MTAINPLKQSLFVNQNTNGQQPSRLSPEQQQSEKPLTIEADYVKSASANSAAQADELFARANDYAKLSDQFSPKVQQSIQAYSAIEMATKRDAISNLMGVDLYA